jgi:hypothetical protein
MSHLVTIHTKVRDPAAVTAACRRLGLAEPVPGTTHLYSGEATGLLVQLPGWQYSAVIDVRTGTLHYDNFEGRWGAQKELDRFLQAYAVERAKSAARAQGYAVREQALTDGSIKLQFIAEA